jgi:hypothetical protein
MSIRSRDGLLEAQTAQHLVEGQFVLGCVCPQVHELQQMDGAPGRLVGDKTPLLEQAQHFERRGR